MAKKPQEPLRHSNRLAIFLLMVDLGKKTRKEKRKKRKVRTKKGKKKKGKRKETKSR
jgi:hypothetical protein